MQRTALRAAADARRSAWFIIRLASERRKKDYRLGLPIQYNLLLRGIATDNDVRLNRPIVLLLLSVGWYKDRDGASFDVLHASLGGSRRT
jgi:hypothetical protein